MRPSHINSNILFIITSAILCIFVFSSSFGASDIKDVQARFKNAKIKMDRKTSIPIKISGLNYKPERLSEIGIPITEKNVEKLFKAFLDENRAVLEVDSENLALVSKTIRKDKWYVKYQQLYKGIPVINSTVGMVGTERGEIKSYAASYNPKIELDVAEKISEEKAIAIAKETYAKEILPEITIRKIEKVIVPAKEGSHPEYYLAWRIDVLTKSDRVKNDKIFIIDALTGKIIQQYPSRFYGTHASGTVNAEIYPENPTDAVTTLPMAHERVRCDGPFWNGTTTTNQSGSWQINTPWWTSFFSQYDANFQLIGPYAHVQDNVGNDYIEDANCRVGNTCNFTWTDTDRDHINVFHHINALHDWYKSHLNYSWVNSWDGTSRFNAEVNHTYNNAYAGDPMGYGTDNFARSSDVVYHECTHNVLHALYGDYVGFPDLFEESYGFDEGFADYFAGAITNDPIHGEGYGGTRTLDNTNMYTNKATYNTEGHTGGTIIAGAAWDLRGMLQARLGDAQGARLVDNLIFDALVGMAAMPRDYYFSDPQESNFLTCLYQADDNNNNLMDGVPHFYYIQEALENHNLLQAELKNRDSYDVSLNTLGTITGGDFYFYDDAFWSNNVGQRGVQDLGDIGTVALENVTIPSTGYTRQRVDAAINHTYVALAQQGEEGSYIVFRVSDFDAASDEVVIQYLYRTPLLIDFDDICRLFPSLCRQIFPCARYRFLCEADIVFPYEDGLIVEFVDDMDIVTVPVEEICKYVLECPGCEPSGFCPGYNINFVGLPQPFGFAVYDNRGRKVAENLKNTLNKTLEFKADKRLKYFLVVSPAKESKLDVQYRLPMKISAQGIPR